MAEVPGLHWVTFIFLPLLSPIAFLFTRSIFALSFRCFGDAKGYKIFFFLSYLFWIASSHISAL